MSKTNENKTPLTAEEELIYHFDQFGNFETIDDIIDAVSQNKIQSKEIFKLYFDYIDSRLNNTSQQLAEKEKEMRKVYDAWDKATKFHQETILINQSTIQSLKEEIEGLKKSIELGGRLNDLLVFIDGKSFYSDPNDGEIISSDVIRDKVKSLLSTNSEEGKEG